MSRHVRKAIPQDSKVLELPISVRDVEREQRVQLKRWRKTHGELSYKSAPRMHGARAVMTAEPHTRQDLHQQPTIIIQSPLPSDTNPEFTRIKKRGTIRKAPVPNLDVPNPYALPTDPKLAPPAPLNNQSKLQPKETAQPKQTPSNNLHKDHPPPSLQQISLTMPETTPAGKAVPPIEKPSQSPQDPSLNKPPLVPTLHLSQAPKPQPSPSLSHSPLPPKTSPDPEPVHPTPIPIFSSPALEQVRHLKGSPSTNTNNSAHLTDHPPTTDSTPLLSDDTPVIEDSVAALKVPSLRNSCESVGSEDTYL